MLKHHLAFPDHKAPIQEAHTNGVMVSGTNSFLFDELMKVVGRASQSDRISTFLAEISNFVSTVRLFKPKILQTEQASNKLTSEYYLGKHFGSNFQFILILNDRNSFAHFDPQNEIKFKF